MAKIVNVEVKTSLQSSLKTKKINFRSPKGYTLVKKNKNKAHCDHQNKNKNKFTQNSTPTNNASKF